MNINKSLAEFGPIKLLDPLKIIEEVVNLDLKASCVWGSRTKDGTTVCNTGVFEF
jgi:hypothetical protein